jgi:FlaA1/EpsC-like NDP-sugar epimerase
MIKLSGLEPDDDIKIEYSGLRPGEKLYEELLNNAENTLQYIS